MTASQKPPRILIVDNDAEMAETVIDGYKNAKKAGNDRALIPVCVDTVRASQSKLSDRDYAYAALFISPAIGVPVWVAVVKTCHQYRPGIPVFVLYDQTQKLKRNEVDGLGIAGFVTKPVDYDQLIGLLGEEGSGGAAADSSVLLDEGTVSKAEAAAETETEAGPSDADVTEVDLANLVGRVKSTFDLYVRLSNGKYVKVLLAGDVLSSDRIQSYLARGARALYVLKSAQAAVLDFCDGMVSAVLSDDSVPPQIKTTQVLAQGESTLRLLRDVGFTERSMQRAQTFVANTTEMIRQISGTSELVRQLLADIAALEHSVASAMLCGLMIKHLGGANPAVFNGVGVACFLHDLSLVGESPVLRDEEMAKLSAQELEIFRRHPEESAKLLAQMPKIPPLVVTAVAQHHLRLDGSGLGTPKGSEEINRLAELIGLSEEFLKLVDKSRDDPSINPVEALRAHAAKAFSEPLVDAFVRTFNEK